MYKITEKIKIVKLVPNSTISFSNKEIKATMNQEFTCLECKKSNHIKITLYEKDNAFWVDDLFKKMNWLAKSDFLLKNKEEEIYCWHKEKGNLLINCLYASYIGLNCKHCSNKYICFFSYGEKQPSLDLFTIAGIWSYEVDNSIPLLSRIKRFIFK